MFHCWYYRLKFPPYFKNTEGLKKFAELCMRSLDEKARKKSDIFKKRNKKLHVEQKNLITRRNEIAEEPLLGNDEYFSIQKRLRTDGFIMYAIIIAEGFLNYISTLIFIPGEESIFVLLRWFVAIVLTGGAIIASEKLIEAILPIKRYKKEKATEKRSVPVIILWSILLIGVEIAVIGVSETRARDIEGGKAGGVLYYGFIILSMVLPIIAGAVRWDMIHYWDAYKNTREYKNIEARLNQIESTIKQNEEQDYSYYQRQLIAYWGLFLVFQTCKENYNVKKGIDENLSNYYCRDFDSFQREADKRYASHFQERKADTITHLTRTNSTPGKKIGQAEVQIASE